MPTLSKRAVLVRAAMGGTRWTSVSTIMKAVARTLRDQRNRRLAPPSLRRAVNHALDELLVCALAEEKPRSESMASRPGLPAASTCAGGGL